MSATADMFASPCIRFRGGMVPLTTLELLRYDPVRFSHDLADKIQQAPMFFRNLPLVISLEKLEGDPAAPDFSLLRQLCTEQGIQLVGIKTTLEEQKRLADAAGLAILQPTKNGKTSESHHRENRDDTTKAKDNDQQPLEDQESNRENVSNDATATSDDPETMVSSAANKIVHTPVRSGQQVYASGGDLIVLAQVSAGAEILADGNIHVYAPLRGRALAGVRGNTEALIFCQSLEAELVSVAGQYKLSEDLQGSWWKKPVKISLKDEKLDFADLC